jgi:hypothetical protein
MFWRFMFLKISGDAVMQGARLGDNRGRRSVQDRSDETKLRKVETARKHVGAS